MKHFWDIFPDGASHKQQEGLTESIRNKYQSAAKKENTFALAIIHQRALKGSKKALEDQILLEELSIAGMCDSIFAYWNMANLDLSNEYLQRRRDDLLEYVSLPTATEYTQGVIDCMKRHYQNCAIARDTYTDGEGCSYNSFSKDPDERMGIEY